MNIEQMMLETNHGMLRMQKQLDEVVSKMDSANKELERTDSSIENYFIDFTRDNYKDWDRRLITNDLAPRILAFKSLGYIPKSPKYRIILGLDEFLKGRGMAALEYFKEFLKTSNLQDKLCCDVNYLCGMLSYNAADFDDAIRHFSQCDKLYEKLLGRHDYQALTYVAETMALGQKKIEEVDAQFEKVEQVLNMAQNKNHELDKAFITLYLKWGNAHFSAPPDFIANDVFDITKADSLLDNKQSLAYYLKAYAYLGDYEQKKKIGQIGTLEVTLLYSIAQALYSAKQAASVHVKLTTNQLFREVFDTLKNILLEKTEAIVLAQYEYMIGTTAYYDPMTVPSDQALMYLEYARRQTQQIPKGILIYSAITKQLLDRREFIQQIDKTIAIIKARNGGIL